MLQLYKTLFIAKFFSFTFGNDMSILGSDTEQVKAEEDRTDDQNIFPG